MSNLKVNTIEPYSGGSVTITGLTVDNATSASYADTANTLTAGGKTINGFLSLSGNSLNNVDIVNASNAVIASGSFGSARLQQAEMRLDVVDTENSRALLLINPDFYSGNEYHGIVSNWYQFGGTATITAAERERAEVLVNAFADDFSYDNFFKVKADSTGVSFNDWALPSYGDQAWMTIAQDGPPTMKRGMSIEGLGDYVDDAAAATGGVPVNGVYRTGSVLKIRVT